MPHGETVHAQYYAAYLQNHLRRAIRRKRPQLQNVIFCMLILLHPRRFVSGICYDVGGGKYWSSHHTPDLSPCDYDLISKLKAPLRGHRLRTRNDIANAVRRLIVANFSHGEADGIRDFHIVGSAQLTVLGITLKACKMLMCL